MTKITAHQRMEHLLLVMALALFWLIRQGSVQANDLLHDSTPSSPTAASFLIKNLPLKEVGESGK